MADFAMAKSFKRVSNVRRENQRAAAHNICFLLSKELQLLRNVNPYPII
jgi:hypothetical protein